METTLHIEVINIQADYKYYSFDYKLTRDGKVVSEDEFSGDHSWGDQPLKFKEHLEKGGAIETLLGQLDSLI